ncbi:TlyA family RNA methyltransferase [Leucobacter chromiireducens]|uniref:TlyA family RNA methyltransferase n=1 Tax=Leucobacter chromiireducens subsp. solipictus TaxID=398235 RepID=A0ABS1SH75_9MICO|nr:TlyA family RNA methyltransferase [Leucobacter chromiireducens]MBL3678824.1 TlyA family RNA methyltransferase [Leucobacter chromiireducens subsp. solipictus]
MATPSAVWGGAPERLDRVLPELGLARSRSRASELIAAGGVVVNGAIAGKPGVRVATGARVEVSGDDHYVGRAAHKLIAALDTFGIDPADRLALDLGASTGGFTQVLLERGARLVQAIDVGRDQLASQLRADPRVRLVEGRNARELTAENLAVDTGEAASPQLVVADLSFISLSLVFPAIVRVAAADAELVLLIKPQFEVGRVRDGVVTSPELWADAIRIVLRAAAENGFAACGLAPSPIAGGSGNREFLGYFSRAASPHPTEWEGRITELIGAPTRQHGADPERDEGAR